MNAKVDLDLVLDLVNMHQQELVQVIQAQSNGTTAYRVLWNEYRAVSELYDDIRRAAE